jgi:hypothetical protein
MLEAAATRPRSLDRIWRALKALRRLARYGRLSNEPKGTNADTLPSAQPPDLGFEADQMSGNIDFAKGQHQRFF